MPEARLRLFPVYYIDIDVIFWCNRGAVAVQCGSLEGSVIQLCCILGPAATGQLVNQALSCHFEYLRQRKGDSEAATAR